LDRALTAHRTQGVSKMKYLFSAKVICPGGVEALAVGGSLKKGKNMKWG